MYNNIEMLMPERNKDLLAELSAKTGRNIEKVIIHMQPGDTTLAPFTIPFDFDLSGFSMPIIQKNREFLIIYFLPEGSIRDYAIPMKSIRQCSSFTGTCDLNLNP